MTAAKHRRGGWLTEQSIRSGMREQWAYNRGPDSLSVTLSFKGGEFVVRAVRISNEHGYQSAVMSTPDIETARGAFRKRVDILSRGDHAALFEES